MDKIAIPGTPSRPLQYLRAVRESDLPTGTRAVCWALASFANNNTGKAYPTVKTLAKATGMKEGTVSRHTGLAQEKGYLHKERHFNGPITYTITVPITEEKTGDTDTETPPVEPLLGWAEGTDEPGYSFGGP
ncbi:helix-turn-helix domain-containing protein [Arthrobacter sp. R-11]|uniref:helix-turn-helix domain-containing protein n=1 Tax=Arthrobacter sp. R-11 TaxID=3404053 RepID=UPI003CE7402B